MARTVGVVFNLSVLFIIYVLRPIRLENWSAQAHNRFPYKQN